MRESPLRSLAEYSRFIAELFAQPQVEHSTVALWSDSPYTGIAEGEVFFENGVRLRLREEIDCDEIDNIDATKLLRAAFLGSASAYYLANLDASQVPALWEVIRGYALERTAEALARRAQLHDTAEGGNLLRFHFAYEQNVIDSLAAFAEVPAEVRRSSSSFLAGLRGLVGEGTNPAPAGSGEVVYRRASDPKGPMGGFGYDYFADKTAQQKIAAPVLLSYQGLWGGGGEYTYEALNLVDGKRTVHQIRDDLAAIYGPVPLEAVAEYLQALAKIGVLVTP